MWCYVKIVIRSTVLRCILVNFSRTLALLLVLNICPIFYKLWTCKFLSEFKGSKREFSFWKFVFTTINSIIWMQSPHIIQSVFSDLQITKESHRNSLINSSNPNERHTMPSMAICKKKSVKNDSSRFFIKTLFFSKPFA